jgi:hypothetical protein
MAAITFAEISSRDQVRSSLNAVSLEGGSVPMRPSMQAELLEFVTDAIWLYFGADDPTAYRDWRGRSGAVLRKQELAAAGKLDLLHGMISYISEANADDLDLSRPIEEIFNTFWAITRRANGGVNRAIAMADAPPGIICRWFRHDGTSGTPALEGPLGRDAWHGGIGMSAQKWFQPAPLTISPVQAAQVGVLLEFEGGMRRPVIFTCVHDPTTNRWDLIQVLMTNFPPEMNLWPWQL